jgi:hypothetical protein
MDAILVCVRGVGVAFGVDWMMMVPTSSSSRLQQQQDKEAWEWS